MLSGLKGPDPPPSPAPLPPSEQCCQRSKSHREKRESGGGGLAQKGYPARCLHCSTAAGGGGSQALLARGFGRTQEPVSRCLGSSLHKELGRAELIRQRGSMASLESAGAAAAARLRRLSPTLVPREGPAPPRAEAGTRSTEGQRDGAAAGMPLRSIAPSSRLNVARLRCHPGNSVSPLSSPHVW